MAFESPPCEGQRQPAALAAEPARAHRRQRLEHPAHRPPAQGGVAGEGGGERIAGRGADDQPHAGAGVAAVDDVGGLGEAARARRPASAPSPSRSTSAPKARMAAAVRSTSSPSSRPSISVTPARHARRGSARGGRWTCRPARGRARARAPPGRAVRLGVASRMASRACSGAGGRLLLTAAPAAWQGSRRFTPPPFTSLERQGSPRLGQSRTGRQADLPELLDQILRSEPPPRRLPQVRHGLRPRGSAAQPPRPRARRRCPTMTRPRKRSPQSPSRGRGRLRGRARRGHGARRRDRRAALITDDDAEEADAAPPPPADDLGVDFAEDEDLEAADDDEVPFIEDEEDDAFPDEEIEGLRAGGADDLRRPRGGTPLIGAAGATRFRRFAREPAPRHPNTSGL